MKYRSKKIIEAEQYKSGMEDGFIERYIDPKEPNRSWGIPTNNDNITINVPFIYDEDFRVLISDGDYIIIDENGIRSICKYKTFHKTYEPIEDKNYPDSIITKDGSHVWIGL